MKKITEEMQELIAKNLPAATAGAMKDFIEESEEVKLNLKESLEKNIIKDKSIDSLLREAALLNGKIEKFEDFNKREKELDGREISIADRERNIKLQIIEIQLSVTQASLATTERLVEKVFGHPSVTVTNSKNVYTPIMHNQGNGCGEYQSGSSTTNTEETKTTTETKA